MRRAPAVKQKIARSPAVPGKATVEEVKTPMKRKERPHHRGRRSMLLLLLAMILISLGMACATCPVCAPSPGNEGPRPSGEFDDGEFEDPDPVGARGD